MEREREIRAFKPEDYWVIEGEWKTAQNASLKLTCVEEREKERGGPHPRSSSRGEMADQRHRGERAKAPTESAIHHFNSPASSKLAPWFFAIAHYGHSQKLYESASSHTCVPTQPILASKHLAR